MLRRYPVTPGGHTIEVKYFQRRQLVASHTYPILQLEEGQDLRLPPLVLDIDQKVQLRSHSVNDKTRTHMITGVERLASRTYTLRFTSGPDTGREHSLKSRIIRFGTNRTARLSSMTPRPAAFMLVSKSIRSATDSSMRAVRMAHTSTAYAFEMYTCNRALRLRSATASSNIKPVQRKSKFISLRISNSDTCWVSRLPCEKSLRFCPESHPRIQRSWLKERAERQRTHRRCSSHSFEATRWSLCRIRLFSRGKEPD